MKPLSIAGMVLAALGAFILLKGLSYGSQRSVMRVGDLQVSAESQRVVPTWVGWIAIVGGAALIGAGVRRRRAA